MQRKRNIISEKKCKDLNAKWKKKQNRRIITWQEDYNW